MVHYLPRVLAIVHVYVDAIRAGRFFHSESHDADRLRDLGPAFF